MTIWYDYTTTLRNTGRSGIAGVEWHIGAALRSIDPDVRAFAMNRPGTLVPIDAATALAGALYATADAAPVAWRTSGRRTWRDDVRAALRLALGPRSTALIRLLSRLYQTPSAASRAAARAWRRQSSGVAHRSHLKQQLGAGDVVVSMGADWSGELPAALSALRRSTGCRVVTMVYDLIPLTHPHLAFHNDRALFTAYYRSLIEASDVITCISEQSLSDLETFARSERLSLPTAAVLRLGDADDPGELGDIGDPDVATVAHDRPFYLWVGTIERRKNLDLLYDALRILESEGDELPTIVVAGAVGWGVRDLLAELELGVTAASRAIVWLGSVDQRTLDGLYRRARALLFPSHYEGWGLPVREALVRGCPVAAGDSPAVREAAGGHPSVVLLPVDDAGPWADFLRSAPPTRDACRPRSWDEAAHDLIRLLTGSPSPSAGEPHR